MLGLEWKSIAEVRTDFLDKLLRMGDRKRMSPAAWGPVSFDFQATSQHGRDSTLHDVAMEVFDAFIEKNRSPGNMNFPLPKRGVLSPASNINRPRLHTTLEVETVALGCVVMCRAQMPIIPAA